jgi:membrane protein involved in colicin uptake
MHSQPWTLFDTDPGAGGGGGGNPVGANGFPESTPVADMSAEHQVAYWKYHARRHEAAVKAAPTAEELAQMRADAAELATRKASELTEAQRIQAEKDAANAAAATAKAEAEAATRRALVLEVAMEKGLSPAQAARLQGATKEALEADAEELKKLFPGQGAPVPPPLSGGQRGGDVKPSTSVSAGADLWRERNPRKN